jgi:hypothetical protein
MESLCPRLVRAALLCAATVSWALSPLHADGKHNPTSKFFVADVDGDSDVDTGNKVDDLTKQSVYNADGTVIETHNNGTNAIVFSNGTGIFFDEDTRMEVKEFQQEPFVPNRTDMNMEPSVSKTDTFIPHGTVGLCTSKLAAGSSMTYATPLGSVNITGGKIVVSSSNGSTVISDLEGVATVNAGETDTGGDVLKDGQQAVITPGANGGPPTVKIQNIPSGQLSGLNAKVTMACNAKKTVYFEARGTKDDDSLQPNNHPNTPANGITAFDGDDGDSSNNNSSNGQGDQQTIVAVPVAPATTPVQFTVSGASLPGTNSAGTP